METFQDLEKVMMENKLCGEFKITDPKQEVKMEEFSGVPGQELNILTEGDICSVTKDSSTRKFIDCGEFDLSPKKLCGSQNQLENSMQQSANAEESASQEPTYVTWIQCDNLDCQKWRRVNPDRELYEGRWVCAMNSDPMFNSCAIDQEFIAESDEEESIYAPYKPGSVVLGKIQGYPWWPGLIDNDPDYEKFQWKEERQGKKATISYHMSFFGKGASRAWVVEQCVRLFTGREELADMGQVASLGKKDLRLLEDSLIQAKLALSLTHEERVRKYGFKCKYPKQKAVTAVKDSAFSNNSRHTLSSGVQPNKTTTDAEVPTAKIGHDDSTNGTADEQKTEASPKTTGGSRKRKTFSRTGDGTGDQPKLGSGSKKFCPSTSKKSVAAKATSSEAIATRPTESCTRPSGAASLPDKRPHDEPVPSRAVDAESQPQEFLSDADADAMSASGPVLDSEALNAPFASHQGNSPNDPGVTRTESKSRGVTASRKGAEVTASVQTVSSATGDREALLKNKQEKGSKKTVVGSSAPCASGGTEERHPGKPTKAMKAAPGKMTARDFRDGRVKPASGQANTSKEKPASRGRPKKSTHSVEADRESKRNQVSSAASLLVIDAKSVLQMDGGATNSLAMSATVATQSETCLVSKGDIRAQLGCKVNGELITTADFEVGEFGNAPKSPSTEKEESPGKGESTEKEESTEKDESLTNAFTATGDFENVIDGAGVSKHSKVSRNSISNTDDLATENVTDQRESLNVDATKRRKASVGKTGEVNKDHGKIGKGKNSSNVGARKPSGNEDSECRSDKKLNGGIKESLLNFSAQRMTTGEQGVACKMDAEGEGCRMAPVDESDQSKRRSTKIFRAPNLKKGAKFQAPVKKLEERKAVSTKDEELAVVASPSGKESVHDTNMEAVMAFDSLAVDARTLEDSPEF